ncbi:MAG: hypothetical protein BWK76_16795 [Desulfobulbaceae bacterium A2]|nr:MAG: hypothetical protein BWK76_16795 [Desulfobulbaceae bacterium A2]
MKKLTTILALVCALALGAGTALALDQAVQIKDKEGVGKYLADSRGKTLYWFKKDAPGKSACAGPCVEKWPLFFGEKIAGPHDVPATDFGTLIREDGKHQTTFRGYPLYYWVNDKEPGDTLGQGVNNIWYVVDPAKFPPQ